MTDVDRAAFAEAYARHRAREGRALYAEDIRCLPWLDGGPLAGQWAVRACSYEAFAERVLAPLAMAMARPLEVLDLGAGNGWLSWRLAMLGHRATAIDMRGDAVDGLGAAAPLVAQAKGRMSTLVADFDAVPLDDGCADLVVFNAALHYARDLGATLGEAARLARAGGRLVILDSPFYREAADGEAMVAEKLAQAAATFGEDAAVLAGQGFIEFLTRASLAEASAPYGLRWRRHPVRYPVDYELRPLRARLRGARRPSRFDVWEAVRP